MTAEPAPETIGVRVARVLGCVPVPLFEGRNYPADHCYCESADHTPPGSESGALEAWLTPAGTLRLMEMLREMGVRIAVFPYETAVWGEKTRAFRYPTEVFDLPRAITEGFCAVMAERKKE